VSDPNPFTEFVRRIRAVERVARELGLDADDS
jgi:hypothetical protein